MRNQIILILMAFLLAGCNVEQKVSQFEGDGTISFVKRPGLLGADGVILAFDTFNISSDFNRTYSFTKLPRLDNTYSLYLCVQAKERMKIMDETVISSQLVDSKGKTIWDVQGKTASWICAEPFGSNRDTVGYYYYEFKENPKNCQFNPTEGEGYKLTVSFQTSPSCKDLNTKAYFCLKAGGFK